MPMLQCRLWACAGLLVSASAAQNAQAAADVCGDTCHDDGSLLAMRAALRSKAQSGQCEGFDCVKRYIDKPDVAYAWHEATEQSMNGTQDGVGWTARVLTVTSQRWNGTGDAKHEVWTHPLVVVFPDTLHSSPQAAQRTVTLLVGGAWLTGEPKINATMDDVRAAIYLATHTGAISAVVLQVPNQRLKFASDPEHKQRIEDEIKAYTWKRFLDHPKDPEVLMELPNAKAVVRAMDATTEFLTGGGHSVDGFALTGCSKRSVAAVMACAYDVGRCKAVVPCVMTTDMPRHAKVVSSIYGGAPVAMKDVVDNNVNAYIDTPEMDRLSSIVDIKGILPKLTPPTLWLVAGADEFFMPDHTSLFWKQLPEPKYVFVREGARHAQSLADDGFLGPTAAFLRATHLPDTKMPQLRWEFNATAGELAIHRHHGSPVPRKVTVWSARSCPATFRRDFRQVVVAGPWQCDECGGHALQGGLCDISRAVKWSSRSLTTEGLDWRVKEDVATGGYTAFFVAFEFDAAGGDSTSDRLQVTTEVTVLPYGHRPFAECQGSMCGVKVWA